MRNLMLSTAMVLPLMMGQVMAQETATPAPAGQTDSTTAAQTDAAPATPAAGDTDTPAATQSDLAASGKVEQQQAENELRIDWITDATVNAPDGTAIGEINDVIVDAQAGTMKAAVIGVGGFLGIGEKQIAVPWDQLTINYDAQQISSDLTKEEAEAAPEYVFRAQEDAPADASAVSSPTDMTATTPANVEGTDDAATTTGGDTAAGGTTAGGMAADGTTAGTEGTGMDHSAPAADGTTGAPSPSDSAETPATEPAESDAAAPADGTTPAPAN